MKQILLAYIFIVAIFVLGNNVLACTPDVWAIKSKAIYGRVVDSYENPIPNAIVQIYKPTKDGEDVIVKITTDENGRFKITTISSGKYAIKANAENFTYSYAALKLKHYPKKISSEEIVFTLVPYFECTGKVEVRKVLAAK